MKRIKLYLFIIIVLIFSGFVINFFLTKNDIDVELQNEQEASKTKNSSSFIPSFEHIVIIVMENRSYEEIVNNKNAPYTNKLIKTGALATNYYAITHPSLPNYIALLGGSTFGTKKNCLRCLIHKTNLIDQLENHKISWRAYFESLPKSCFLESSYPYTRKYNPFVYFTDIIKNPKRCNNLVAYSQFSKDLKKPASKLPDFIWISPNLCHDTHYCQVQSGDKWLSQEVPKILRSSLFNKQNALLIITWDEAERRGRNHIATIFIGKTVRKGYRSNQYYNHYSLLHTIESAWKIPPINKNVKKNTVMSDFFINNKSN